jgi:hypothetical protein
MEFPGSKVLGLGGRVEIHVVSPVGLTPAKWRAAQRLSTPRLRPPPLRA